MHLDIKKMNIMYSPRQKELVFIDFGFSRVIEEKLGFKTLTKFLGSVNYCSPEMVKLFSAVREEKNYVDLYYNDVHCFTKAITELFQ